MTGGSLGLGGAASFLVVSLAVRLVFVGVGDLALDFFWEILSPVTEVTPVLGAWRDPTEGLIVPVDFLGVPVAFLGVLRLGMGSLDAPPGVFWVGMGSFEAPPVVVRGGGTGRLDRPLPGAVAPRLAAPLLAVPPPEVLLIGTGSLDFQAGLVPVPRACLVGGGAATPLFAGFPASLSAVGGVRECLPEATAETVVLAMSSVQIF